MPGTLLEPEVELLPGTEDRVEGIVQAHGGDTWFWLQLSATGSVAVVGMDRWGAPDQGGYQYHPFGGIIEDDEATFAGITIPTLVRMGWHFGSRRFAADGEFFRAKIRSAAFR